MRKLRLRESPRFPKVTLLTSGAAGSPLSPRFLPTLLFQALLGPRVPAGA